MRSYSTVRKATEYPCWRNDPNWRDLHGAFIEDAPNLSTDFKVNGLRPILREDNSDRYILRDAEGIYYLWDLWDGHLVRVGEHWVKGPHLHTVEHAVGNILCELTWIEDDSQRVYRTYSQKQHGGIESQAPCRRHRSP
jgi:hypothetical protein